MSLEDKTEDGGGQTRVLRSETSETSSRVPIQFPVNTNLLVVDTNFITLLNMKKIMKQYAYEVTVYADAEEALAFLKNCKHEINIVIWDFHMPVINGLQALEIIGSKMDLPVVIMSDDNQVESVMKATMHGACDYVMKPVREEVIANIWQHIVRKRMVSSKPSLIPPVQLDPVRNDGSKEVTHDDDSVTVDQDNTVQSMIDKMEEEERAAKEQQMRWIAEIPPIPSDVVQSNKSLDQDKNHDDSNTMNQHNGEQNIEKKRRKPRMKWTKDLERKFLLAIKIVGGPGKANPKELLKCLQDMEIEGLTRSNVSSHLQKFRISLEEKQMSQQVQGIGWSGTSCMPPPPPLLGMNNVHSSATSSLLNGRAVYPSIQQNQYQNGYLSTMNNINNNQFMTNPQPRLPYFDHHHDHLQQQQQQQQYDQLPQPLDYMMSNNEPEQASSSIGVTDLEPLYPSLTYDPQDFLFNGYSFNQ